MRPGMPENRCRRCSCHRADRSGGTWQGRSVVVRRRGAIQEIVRLRRSERSKNKSKRPRTTAPAYVSKLEIPDDIKHPLEELARKFDNKVFLPTFGDTNFCNLYRNRRAFARYLLLGTSRQMTPNEDFFKAIRFQARRRLRRLPTPVVLNTRSAVIRQSMRSK